ncbi:hypothetical protein TTRE_0000713001 [Trichuris trichiura]|uniref:Uncharacterized protein n=1 Tax=Trichuris trichiura TaxID=36087 RepID=A0A077ZJQ0_TRITR|nr:hypothetical protein TTRE_0000713001 [Trichuris trichiura]
MELDDVKSVTGPKKYLSSATTVVKADILSLRAQNSLMTPRLVFAFAAAQRNTCCKSVS